VKSVAFRRPHRHYNGSDPSDAADILRGRSDRLLITGAR
jgi:hypothetical protein